ncbi:MAG: HXXEE domain-containing protein, partial [Verrucomicrobiaceae bacterium]|nr:HXXEE domain-containing protein [Verrucomicrobiaceae bacterium]
SNSQFLFLNAIFWLLTVATIVVVLTRASQAWLVITLAAVLGINAGVHLLGSIVTATYSPGTVTAALLYVPLVVYALRRVLPHVSRGLAMRAVTLGAAIYAGVFFLAANPSLIPSP